MEYRCSECMGRVCYMTSNKREAPQYCPFCGERNDWEVFGTGDDHDDAFAFRTVEDLRDYGWREDNLPEEIVDAYHQVMPYNWGMSNMCWGAMSRFVDSKFFGGDPYELRREFDTKVKHLTKFDIANVFVRNGFAGGIVVREYARKCGTDMRELVH